MARLLASMVLLAGATHAAAMSPITRGGLAGWRSMADAGFPADRLAAFEARVASGARVPAAQWQTQPVDHFNPQTGGTFKQRYWVNDTHYDAAKGGPLYVNIGGESAANPIWVSDDVEFMVNAAANGALAVMVEHRFYGQSQPFGDLSTEHLQYLSSDQALADVATLISSLQGQYPGLTKTIVFGGSYSGALAGWFRLKYPQHADAAVATSSPLLAQLDFMGYYEVVTASLQTSTLGRSCTNRIMDAASAIQSMLATDTGRASLSKDFATCTPLTMSSSAQDVSNFVQTALFAFAGVVQYNRDNRAFEGATNTNITVEVVCQMMAGTNAPADPLGALVDVSNLLNLGITPSGAPAAAAAAGASRRAPPCLDYDYKSMVAMLANPDLSSPGAMGGRQWTYQTCAEFAYFQTSDGPPNLQVFGPPAFAPLEFYTQLCTDVYGPKFTAAAVAANVNETNILRGGKRLVATNVLVPNGSIDPWHWLSITQADPSLPGVTPVFITGTAHCANMYPATGADLPSLTAARKQIASFVNAMSKA